MTEPPCSVGVVTYILHESVMGPFLFSASVALNITIHLLEKEKTINNKKTIQSTLNMTTGSQI